MEKFDLSGQGRIQDFHLGEGAQKIMSGHAHHEREARSSLRPGSRARLRALEPLGGFDALLCYMSQIFKHSDTKWDLKNTVSNFRGARLLPPAPPPPSNSATGGNTVLHGRGNDPTCKFFLNLE